ncbi:isopentenyl-diphosphate delta-isomerase idi1 [Entomophthora muscae]|uniref:Isopentenyl-diphosphate delta-isomerase idi1 n=1 Tax=Entomophthora muscae TaxID=34485 RepID=A0ACC2UGD5_9FUNG|nr:isopentenyl-diphosphate delta-isomerase idi1 [Entomophthora muscae]
MSLDLSEYDDEQVRLMEEMCILVDEQDKIIGAESKKVCHLMENINKGCFTRASEKITFPSMFTNTCCSHPLNFAEELEEKDQLGVRIKPEQVPLDKFRFLTRIHYKAESDGIWGEHEVDYILFIKADVDLNVNVNEVSSVKYVSSSQLKTLFQESKQGKVPMTPWFRLICETFLFDWWSVLESAGDLGVSSVPADIKTIHKL